MALRNSVFCASFPARNHSPSIYVDLLIITPAHLHMTNRYAGDKIASGSKSGSKVAFWRVYYKGSFSDQNVSAPRPYRSIQRSCQKSSAACSGLSEGETLPKDRPVRKRLPATLSQKGQSSFLRFAQFPLVGSLRSENTRSPDITSSSYPTDE